MLLLRIWFFAMTVGLPILCLIVFVWLASIDWKKEETKLSDSDAQKVKDDMYVLIQRQERDRLLLIEKENKDINLDEED